MTTTTADRALQHEGFCILDGLVPAADLTRMRRAADAAPGEVQVWYRDQVPAVLGELLWRGPIAVALLRLLGPQATFLSLKAVTKGRAATLPSPWHQDRPYWGGSAAKHSLWIALDDATPANGCLRVIPGSHHHALSHERPHAADPSGRFGNRLAPDAIDETQAIDVPLRTGQALLFHDQLAHASHPGLPAHPRRSLIATYRAQREEADDHWSIHQPL